MPGATISTTATRFSGCGTGLRQSELFALKWKDVDFSNQQLWVTRSIVQQVVGRCKTEASQKPVPLHDHLIRSLRSWNRRTPYRTPESWVFASPQNRSTFCETYATQSAW